MNSPFFSPLIGAEPGRAKEESRITCMRMLRTPPFFPPNHKNYNFLACDWFKNVLFSTNSLAKLLSDSLLLDSLLLDSLLSDRLISQSHSKM